jgi:hypothetical protein
MKKRILQTSAILFLPAAAFLTFWMLNSPLPEETKMSRKRPLLRALTHQPASVSRLRRMDGMDGNPESFKSVTMSFGNPEFGERNFAPASVRGFPFAGMR